MSEGQLRARKITQDRAKIIAEVNKHPLNQLAFKQLQGQGVNKNHNITQHHHDMMQWALVEALVPDSFFDNERARQMSEEFFYMLMHYDDPKEALKEILDIEIGIPDAKRDVETNAQGLWVGWIRSLNNRELLPLQPGGFGK